MNIGISQFRHTFDRSLLYKIWGVKSRVFLYMAQVCHRPVVCHVHWLPHIGFLALHQTQSVYSVVDAHVMELVQWQPLPISKLTAKQRRLKTSLRVWNIFHEMHLILPGSFCIEKQHKKELLLCLFLSAFTQIQNICRRNWNGNAVVKNSFPGHVRIDNLLKTNISLG